MWIFDSILSSAQPKGETPKDPTPPTLASGGSSGDDGSTGTTDPSTTIVIDATPAELDTTGSDVLLSPVSEASSKDSIIIPVATPEVLMDNGMSTNTEAKALTTKITPLDMSDLVEQPFELPGTSTPAVESAQTEAPVAEESSVVSEVSLTTDAPTPEEEVHEEVAPLVETVSEATSTASKEIAIQDAEITESTTEITWVETVLSWLIESEVTPVKTEAVTDTTESLSTETLASVIPEESHHTDALSPITILEESIGKFDTLRIAAIEKLTGIEKEIENCETKIDEYQKKEEANKEEAERVKSEIDHLSSTIDLLNQEVDREKVMR